jgi:heme/copper-type cytochrome/quinol oxidase subunit 2
MDTVGDAVLLLFLSILTILFTFGPMFLMISNELAKFKNNDVREHTSGQSQITYYLYMTLFLVISTIVYSSLIWFLEFTFQEWGNLSGAGGISEQLWTVQHVVVDELGSQKEKMVSSIHDTVIVLRGITETLCFAIIFMMILFSVKTTNSMMASFRDDTERNSLVGTVIKIFAVSFVSYITIVFYSEATSGILNHPNNYGVWDISTQWIKSGIEEFGLTLSDDSIN